jgi:hypothetical protein
VWGKRSLVLIRSQICSNPFATINAWFYDARIEGTASMVTYAEDRSCTTQFELGELFLKGNRQSRDFEEAFKWYMVAAKKGSRQAQHRLGMMYARGQGVAQSYSRSYAWCKVATFQHSERARRKLKTIESKMNWDQLRRGNWLAQEFYDRYVVASKTSRCPFDSTCRSTLQSSCHGMPTFNK